MSDTTPAAPFSEGLDHVFYWVADMDRAVEFYRAVLGLPLIRRDGDAWAEFDAGAIRFALHGAAEGRPAHPGGTASFRVRDIDAAKVLLAERGVALAHEGEVEGYARFASFLDPDGNTVQIIEHTAR